MRQLVGLLALAAAVTFALQNLASVEVAFLVWSFVVPKVVIVCAAFGFGILTGWGLITLIRASATP